jgi:hypothetical protein
MEGLEASVVLIAVFLGIVLAVILDLYCLLHLGATERARFLPKPAWAAVIVCVSPLGAGTYLLCHRRRS